MSSIAISAVIRPSRILLLALSAMCLCNLATGVLVALDLLGKFHFSVRALIACLLIGSPLPALFVYIKSRKSLRIDISGIGQIRLIEHTRAAQAFAGQQGEGKHDEEEFRLEEGTILWPNLLFLHLRSNKGRRETLRILPDSVTRDEFRALTIACRWIAARKDTEASLSA